MMNPFKTKKGLGRGLSSLIGETKIEIATNKALIGELSPNKWGDTYFATYTYAMKTGKTRSPSQVSDLLNKNGFSRVKVFPSRRPFVTTVIEAYKN